jgi:hypothetical protein
VQWCVKRVSRGTQADREEHPQVPDDDRQDQDPEHHIELSHEVVGEERHVAFFSFRVCCCHSFLLDTDFAERAQILFDFYGCSFRANLISSVNSVHSVSKNLLQGLRNAQLADHHEVRQHEAERQ